MRMENRIPQSVLVTGANGFIGQHLVRRLIECGCRVTCLVRASSHIDELWLVGAQMVTGDVTDQTSIERALVESRADVVFHLAGLVRALRTDDFARVNTGGTESVAAACAHLNNPPRLVVVSSLAAAGPCSVDLPRVEKDSPSPVCAYGRSKLAGELAAARYAERVPITIVRPPVVFGPGDRAVLEMFRPIARWGIHAVPGSGEQRFSLVHVSDLVEGLLLAAEKGERLQSNGSSGQGIYFMPGQENPAYAELGQAIAAALGKKHATVMHVPRVLLKIVGRCNNAMAKIRQRPCWLSSDKITEALAGSWMCSSAKARTHLNWSPAATLAQRLHETAQWYHQAGWL
jgi:nucleoside-diphosphate-sugar epimerase